MSAPNLTISVEPTESGAVVYGPMAPKTAGAKPDGQLALKLAIRNNESSTVKANQLAVAFANGPAVNPVAIPANLQIASHDTAILLFATAQEIILPVPAPGAITLSVTCDGFSAPAVLTMPLAAEKTHSYPFPGHASDLRLGEYWTGRSASHAPAGDGSQLFAYDMGVLGWDFAHHAWSELLPGTAGDKNEHYRIWGKPVYAMADGTVVEFRNDIPSNPKMGTQVPTPDPVEGNHVYLQHGDELVLYAHFQPGSLNADLAKVGAPVKAGDFLGLAGNSGNSTNPHLHIHAIHATAPWSGPLRPLPFHSIQVVDRAVLAPPDPAGPWVQAANQCLPNVAAAIWPAATTPSWYPPGWPEVARHGIPEATYQAEFAHITSSGYRPVWVDGYDVDGDTFFNAVFHPADGTAWEARHGMSGDEYDQEFADWTKKGYRLLQVESYLSDGDVLYAAIFVKSPGSAFTAYHGCSADEHQNRFDSLTKDGWRPINISVVAPGGVRSYATLYEKRDVGSFIALSLLTPAEYQVEFLANVSAGRGLVYVDGYTLEGEPRISAIWHQKHGAALVARHGLTSAEYQVEYDKQRAAGLLTRAVTGYEEAGSASFAAFWSK